MMTKEERLSSLEGKFETFVQEMLDFKNELRDRDNQRAAEIMALRQKHDEDIKTLNSKIDAKFDSLSNQIHNLTTAAFVGFGAIALAVGGLVVAALKQ